MFCFFRSSGGLTPDPSPKGEESSINPSSLIPIQEFKSLPSPRRGVGG